MPITTIFFDVGGTLLYPDMGRMLAPLLARVQPTAEQLAAADRAAKYSCPLNGDDGPAASALPLKATNKGHWQVFFETLLAEVGHHELLTELAARASDSSYWTLVDPAAPAALAALQRDYKLAVISNADGRIREVLARAGLAGYFDQITDSGLVGYEKPHPRIFQAALEATGSNPNEGLYIGDIYAIDYRGATAAGMHAVLIDPAGVYRDWDAPRIASLRELPAWVARR
ncbi:MAG: HAD family hydrolase [Terriglobales bacterium]